jgi:hydroxymethylpyrimidine pyrophosphatase-like HAD family hydrolase
MGNGGEEAKAAADLVTDCVEEDGLYKAFQTLGLMERGAEHLTR